MGLFIFTYKGKIRIQHSEEVIQVTTYQILMVSISIISLIVAILSYVHKKRNK